MANVQLNPYHNNYNVPLQGDPLDTWYNWYQTNRLSFTKSQYHDAIMQLVQLQSARRNEEVGSYSHQLDELMGLGMSRAAALGGLNQPQLEMPAQGEITDSLAQGLDVAKTAGTLGTQIAGLIYGAPQFSMNLAQSNVFPQILQTALMTAQANQRVAANEATLSDYQLYSSQQVGLFDAALSAYRSAHPDFSMPDNFESLMDLALNVTRTDPTSIALSDVAHNLQDNGVLSKPFVYGAFSRAYSNQYTQDYYDAIVRRNAFAGADLAALNVDQAAAQLERSFQDIYNNHLNAQYTGEQILLAEAERDWYLEQIGLTRVQTSKTNQEKLLLGVQTEEENLNYDWLQHMNKVRIKQAEQQLIYLSTLPDSQFKKEAQRLMRDTDLGLVLSSIMYAQAIDAKALYQNEDAVRVACASQNLGLMPYTYQSQTFNGIWSNSTQNIQGQPFMHTNSAFDKLFNPNYDTRGNYKFTYDAKFAPSSQDSMQP